MFEGFVRKMHDNVVQDTRRTVVPSTEETWVGFECRECGAPLAVRRTPIAATHPAPSSRGWRVTCTGCGVTTYYELGTPMVRVTTS